MTAYPVIRDPGSIERLLTMIREAELPSIVGEDFLNDNGFRREADVRLLDLLEFLGYTKGGKPTVLWERSLEPDEAPALLGRSVKAAYDSLFRALPDALEADGTVLMDFFRKNTGAADPDAAYMILTFKVLADIAEFPPDEVIVEVPMEERGPSVTEEVSEEVPEEPVSDEPLPEPVEQTVEVDETGPCGPVIRLSIHIDISGDTDPEIREMAHRLLRLQLDTDGNC